jgi:acetate kinase
VLARLTLRGVLVVNAGSTSLKLALVDTAGRSAPVASLAEAPRDVEAVAHRIVHGGPRLHEPVVVDGAVLAELERACELAPLHNRPALEALHEARERLPEAPHVAVFDSAFHATLPAAASTYALPARWREEWGARRYGFHGLSVEWAAGRVPVRRLAVCHLGGGCSVTAVLDGRSVDTTMGFSPLEGVPMATRSGSVDTEIALHLLRSGRLSLEQVGRALEEESGLLGLSGLSGRVEELEADGGEAASLALEVFAYRVAGAVGAMAVALDGLDALAFTGGVGEGSARVRRDVCARLGFLGLQLDERANRRARGAARVDAAGSRVRVEVVRAREDLVAARAARALLAPTRPRPKART